MDCASHAMARNVRDKKVGGRKRGKTMKLSTDAQSIAARERRHRISERFKILQSLVPGGSKMDTVSMLEEAIHYVKFLKTQIWLHQSMINSVDGGDPSLLLSPNYLSPKQITDLYPQAPNMAADTHALQQQLRFPHSASWSSYEEIMPVHFDAKMLY